MYRMRDNAITKKISGTYKCDTLKRSFDRSIGDKKNITQMTMQISDEVNMYATEYSLWTTFLHNRIVTSIVNRIKEYAIVD